MNDRKITTARAVGFKTAILLILISIAMLASNGLNLGIDFTGGVITRFTTTVSVAPQTMQALLAEQLPDGFTLTAAKNSTQWTVRQGVTAPHDRVWLKQLNQAKVQGDPLGVSFLDADFIGPQVGDELINQGGLAMIASLLVIMLYLAVRFEWRLAVGSIVALFHDVLVVLGVFAAFQLEFNLTVLAAILAVIGYSLNDSIIVGDRVRELMRVNKDSTLDKIINAAIQSTLTRTLITSGTTLATISAIWLLAGTALAGFAIALFVGILVGTLSSICIAATVPVYIGLDIDHYQPKAVEAQILEP